jgi:hypothetical protein
MILQRLAALLCSERRNQSAAPELGHDRVIHCVVSEPIDDERLDIMTSEIADLTKGMREFLLVADRFLYLAGFIAVGALTLGIIAPDNGRNWLILALAPYPIGIVYGYLMQIYTEVERRAGHKQFLEEEVNRRLRSPVLLESVINSSKERTRLSGQLMALLQGALLSSFVVISLRQTWRFAGEGPRILGFHPVNWNTANLLFLLLAALVIVRSLYENRIASDRAYDTAKRTVEAATAKEIGEG